MRAAAEEQGEEEEEDKEDENVVKDCQRRTGSAGRFNRSIKRAVDVQVKGHD